MFETAIDLGGQDPTLVDEGAGKRCDQLVDVPAAYDTVSASPPDYNGRTKQLALKSDERRLYQEYHWSTGHQQDLWGRRENGEKLMHRGGRTPARAIECWSKPV